MRFYCSLLFAACAILSLSVQGRNFAGAAENGKDEWRKVVNEKFRFEISLPPGFTEIKKDLHEKCVQAFENGDVRIEIRGTASPTPLRMLHFYEHLQTLEGTDPLFGRKISEEKLKIPWMIAWEIVYEGKRGDGDVKVLTHNYCVGGRDLYYVIGVCPKAGPERSWNDVKKSVASFKIVDPQAADDAKDDEKKQPVEKPAATELREVSDAAHKFKFNIPADWVATDRAQLGADTLHRYNLKDDVMTHCAIVLMEARQLSVDGIKATVKNFMSQNPAFAEKVSEEEIATGRDDAKAVAYVFTGKVGDVAVKSRALFVSRGKSFFVVVGSAPVDKGAAAYAAAEKSADSFVLTE